MDAKRLEDLREKADYSVHEQRKIRDGLNRKQKEHIQARNRFNKQVREIIAEVQRHKAIRDKANKEVQNAKSIRAGKNEAIKDAKKALQGSEHNESFQNDLAKAIEAQNTSHKKVVSAQEIAQSAHNTMLSLSEEVDALREKADDCQKQVRKTKREADRAHRSYIVSLRCLHSLNDILRTSRNAPEENQADEDEELEELEPLTNEQIQTATTIITDYYESSNPNLGDRARKHSDFIDSIEYELVPGTHKMIISSHRVGALIGKKGAIIEPLQEKLLEHFPHIRVDIQSIEKNRDYSTKSKPKGYTEYEF